MTSTTANRLLLTRNQIAVICHNDPESIRQMERLFAVVQALSTSSTGSAVTSSPAASVDLNLGDAELTVSLAVGRYMVRALVLTNNFSSSSISGAATVTGTLLGSFGALGTDSYTEFVASASGTSIFSGAGATDSFTLDAIVTVTAAGTYGVTVSGSGTVLEGSYFSATRIS